MILPNFGTFKLNPLQSTEVICPGPRGFNIGVPHVDSSRLRLISYNQISVIGVFCMDTLYGNLVSISETIWCCIGVVHTHLTAPVYNGVPSFLGLVWSVLLRTNGSLCSVDRIISKILRTELIQVKLHYTFCMKKFKILITK